MKSKMRNLRNVLKICMIAIMAAAVLTACGSEKTVDYTIEGEETEQKLEQQMGDGQKQEAFADEKHPDSNSQDPGGKIGLAQFEGEEAWKDTLTTKLVTDSGNGENTETYADVRVDAEIIVPQIKEMSVVEIVETEFDEDYKKFWTENLFGTGEIYYGNVANLPGKEIEKLWPEYEAGVVVMPGEPFNLEEWNNEWSDCYMAYNDLENLKETYTPVDTYTENKYLGKYEDRMYRLTFLEDEIDRDGVYRYMKRVTFEVNDIYEVCPDKFKEQKNLTSAPFMFGDWIENPCELSEEEALKVAKYFVDNLRLDTSVFAYSRPLAWGNVPEVISITDTGDLLDWGVNGYVFYFDLGLDDISFIQYGVEDDYFGWDFAKAEEVEVKKEYSLRSQLQVYVTDNGVIKMVLDNPVEITGVSEGVELLPLDTVKEIIRKELNAQWQVFRFNTYYPLDMNEMELIYFRVRDKEHPGKYSYVPTWRLGTIFKEEITHGIDIRNQVLINAIDGTVIDFYDET